ncbi:MAG: 3-phosphoshikimate 1-carboxyvinyltransferase [Atopobiaceae bacterium]|nr:3-phosphoshikimate 1-carboxyvinyltransferase [Atopobiaceae bacterium]
MIVRITPARLSGTITAPSSKSVAHRALICAALADGISTLILDSSNDDIEATISCLEALGARIVRNHTTLTVHPIEHGAFPDDMCVLDCAESGSTLRFMMGVVAALGRHAEFRGRGRLGKRPIDAFAQELSSHGVKFDVTNGLPFRMEGKLSGGTFCLPGNLSSQFATALLLASPLIDDRFELWVKEPVESLPYIEMTCACMSDFSVPSTTETMTQDDTSYRVWHSSNGTRYAKQTNYIIEGDWSGAAFWLCAAALGSVSLDYMGAQSPTSRTIEVSGLKLKSTQGDRAVIDILQRFGAEITETSTGVAVRTNKLEGCTIDASHIPDLIMPLAAVAAVSHGTTRISHCGRLRLKESDRLQAIVTTLSRLGASVTIEGDDLVFQGVEQLSGATLDCMGDHRVAMLGALAAIRATGDVELDGAEVVSKSYPAFFEDYAQLGGTVHVIEENNHGI